MQLITQGITVNAYATLLTFKCNNKSIIKPERVGGGLYYSVCVCVCVCYRQIFVNTQFYCFLDTAFETLTSEDVQF